MVVDFVRTQIGPVHAHTSWLARSIFVYCGLLGKSQHRIMTFLEEKKKRKRAEKNEHDGSDIHDADMFAPFMICQDDMIC